MRGDCKLGVFFFIMKKALVINRKEAGVGMNH